MKEARDFCQPLCTELSLHQATPSIALDHVHREYDGLVALHDLSITILAGQVVGLLGPNGAGKSTLIKILTGFISPSSGQARIVGIDTRDAATRAHVGYLPEHVPLYEQMLVHDYLLFMARMRGVAPERLGHVIATTGLSSVLGKPIAALSKGYRQRVGLAQAIVHEPDVLLLDEPTTGLDPNQILEVRALIRALGEQRTVLFSTHIMQEVVAVCDRVLVLHRGRLVMDALVDDLEAASEGNVLTHLEQRFYALTHPRIEEEEE